MKLILIVLFAFLSFRGHLDNITLQKKQPVSCDTSIIEIDSIRQRILIDTNLHFINIKEFAAYKHKKDSLFKQLIVKNDRISAQTREKLLIDNSILFARLMYKYLIGCDKDSWQNFVFLNVILKDYNLFTREQLIGLFNLFPEKFRNSTLGKKHLATINGRPDNLGRSIYGVGDVSFETVGGTLMPFQKLIDRDHEFSIIIFTASWCRPCRYYANIYKSALDKMNKRQVKVISISIDESRTKWLKYLKEENYPWSNFRTTKGFNNKIMNYLHVGFIPYYLLLDKEGIIIDEQSSSEMQKIIDRVEQGSNQ